MLDKFSGRVPVWYCTNTGKKTINKPTDTSTYIYFPSTSEYNCYLMLRECFPKTDYKIYTQQTIESLQRTWKVDFKITAITNEGKNRLKDLVEHLNDCSLPLSPTSIWIEYKGIQDKNFRRQLSHFLSCNSILCKRLVLISDEPSYFVLENPDKLTRKSHPIISKSYFRSAILKFVRKDEETLVW